MYVLFNGLPAEYDSVVQSLKVTDQVKFHDACQHIRDYEEVQKLKKETELANHVKETEKVPTTSTENKQNTDRPRPTN